MTTTDSQTEARPVISDEQVEAINRARDALEAISAVAMSQAWDAPSHVSGDKPYAQNLGRVAGAASMAADNLFDVLNTSRAYGVADLTDDQVHNRSGEEA